MAQELVLLTEWRERLNRQSESGLTIEAFCEKDPTGTARFGKRATRKGRRNKITPRYGGHERAQGREWRSTF